MKRFLLSLTLILLVIAAAVPASAQSQDIVDIAAADDRFETLVAAVTAADLVDTLKGEGPFTVFAPTDDAFAALPEGTVDALLNDIPALTDLLLYHVVPGKVMAADVVNLTSADTAQGQPVQISVQDGKVFINGAEVIITDIEASNGVIHVIDAVILPETPQQPTQLPATGGETVTSSIYLALALGMLLLLAGLGVSYRLRQTNS